MTAQLPRPHIKELDELERELISYDPDSTLFDLLQPTVSATRMPLTAAFPSRRLASKT